MMTIKTIKGKEDKTGLPQRKPNSEGNYYKSIIDLSSPGMNERIRNLRKISFDAAPPISIDRAIHQTEFYRENNGKYSIPVMRALSFLDHCSKKTI